uniref:Spen paralogue and orthologue SPOC C-terminal domain-containing protein n=1 Tax=Globodera rostochiensis TaxID=31243 RepID=A0A914IA99_GLORO
MDEDIVVGNNMENAQPSSPSDPVLLIDMDGHNNNDRGENSIEAHPSNTSDPALLANVNEHNNDGTPDKSIEGFLRGADQHKFDMSPHLAQPSSPSDAVLLVDMDEHNSDNSIEVQPSSTTDPALLAKMDEQMLRLNGFHPLVIDCERLEIAFERDKKALEREKLRQERERRADIAEQKRKQRRDKNEGESDERRERKKRRRSGGGDKVRVDAVTPLKRNFNRIVQCCFCELIVRPERRVDLVRKCVKDSERILLIDLKGNIMNSSTNPTIETLEMYINQNPSYNPLIDDARLEAATQRVVDPAQQKKIDLMRMDVRKAIETSLQKRCKTANMNFSMKRYKDLGLDIERVLFATHQDVNVKYRKWFKNFMTVVNDEKNAYFKEVMRDKVSVKRLITLNEEQMQVAMPVAVLAAADSTSSENANGISAASSSALVRPVSVNKRPAVHGKSAVDEILGESRSDTTLLHTTHLFDANCEICKKEQAKKQAMRKRAEERESMLDAQVKLQQLQQGKPFFPNMDPAIVSAMMDTNMPPAGVGGDPPSRHLRTAASAFDAPLSSLDPAIRAAMMDTNMPMSSACGTAMLPLSRHHRTASRDFDPPLSSAVGGATTPLDTGYDPEHDPLGLNTVQVGDPLMEEDGDGVVEQQHRPDIDDDDGAFGFGAGGAFDDDDFGGNDGGDTFSNDANVGRGNVLQRRAFPPRRASPTPAFSNCGFDGGDDNRDTGRPFQQAMPSGDAFRPRSVSRNSQPRFGPNDDEPRQKQQQQRNERNEHQQRASPPPHFSSNANLQPLGSVRRFPRFEKTTEEANTEQHHRQQENSVFVAEPTTSFGSGEQQLQPRHLSPAAFARSQRVALQQAAECTPHRTLYNESWKERGRQQQPHLLQDIGASSSNVLRADPPTEINETPPFFVDEAASDPWKTMSLVVWRGLFVWNRQTFFNCTCTAVSGGRAVFKAGREMVGDSGGGGGGDAGRIHLIGRSESRGVWEYVLQLRDSWNKQVCLMVINRPEDEHDFVTYMNCFERYNQGTQVGVLDFSDHPTIKDGYVFTLSAGEALPAVLLPLDGVGLPEWAKHNGSIVLMLIRRMDHEDKQWKRRMGCDQQQPPLNIPLTPFASGAVDDRMVRVLSDPSMQPQQQFAENEVPFVNTVDEVIEAIQRIDNPKEVIYFVTQFTRQRERTLRQADYERIQCAIRETAAAHRQRQQWRPPQQQQQQKQQWQRTEPLPAPEERQQKETEPENLISSDLTTEEANAEDNTQRPYSPSEWESLTPEAIAAVTATVAVARAVVPLSLSSVAVVSGPPAEAADGSPQPPPPQNVELVGTSPQPPPPPPQSAEIAFGSPRPPPPPPQSAEIAFGSPHPPPPPPPQSAEIAFGLPLPPPPPPLFPQQSTGNVGNFLHSPPPPPPPPPPPLIEATPLLLFPSPPSLPLRMATTTTAPMRFAFPPSLPLRMASPMFLSPPPPPPQMSEAMLDDRGNQLHPLMAMDDRGNQQHSLMAMDDRGNQPHPLMAMDGRGNQPHPLMAMDDRGNQPHPLMAMDDRGNQPHPLMAMDDRGNQPHPVMAMNVRGNQPHPLMAMDDRGNQPHPLMAMDDLGNQPHPLMAMGGHGNQRHPLMAMGGRGNHSSMMMGGRGNQQHSTIAMGGHGNHSSMMMGGRGNQQHPLMAMGGRGNPQHPLMSMGGHGNQQHSPMAMGVLGNQQHSSMTMGGRGNQQQPLMAMGVRGNQQHPLMAMGGHGNQRHPLMAMGGRGNQQHSSIMMGGRGNQQRW